MQIEKDGLISSKWGNNVLTFNEKSHRYRLNGKAIGSVTGIGKKGYPESPLLIGWKIGQGAEYAIKEYGKLLAKLKPGENPLKKNIDEIVKKSKTAFLVRSQEAADIGTIVHNYAYCTEVGKPFDYSVVEQHPDKAKIKAAIGEFKKFHATNKDEILGLELIVANVYDWYAGKFDRLSKRQDKIILSDYKTSSSIFIDMFLQLALYRKAVQCWLEIQVDGLEIIRLGKDGAFETRLMDDPNEIQDYEDQAIRNLQTTRFMKAYEGNYGF